VGQGAESKWVMGLGLDGSQIWVQMGHRAGSRLVTELIATDGWEQQASKYPFKLMSLINNKQSSQEWMLFISDAYFPILVLACHFSFLWNLKFSLYVSRATLLAAHQFYLNSMASAEN
jgi:hypothetical protein